MLYSHETLRVTCIDRVALFDLIVVWNNSAATSKLLLVQDLGDMYVFFLRFVKVNREWCCWRDGRQLWNGLL